MKPIREWWDAIEGKLGRPGIYIVLALWLLLFFPRLFILLPLYSTTIYSPKWKQDIYHFLYFSRDWE